MKPGDVNRKRLTQRLMAAFFIELGERSNDLNRDLLELEKQPVAERQELLNRLFRTAHSLKGASRAVRQTLLEQLAHYMEDQLGEVRDGARPLTPELFDRLFRFADAVADAAVRIRDGKTLEGSAVEKMVEQLLAGPGSSPGLVAREDRAGAPPPVPAVTAAPAETPAAPAPVAAPEPAAAALVPASAPVPDVPADGIATTLELPPVSRAVRGLTSVRVSEDRLDLLRGHTAELSMALGRLDLRSEELLTLRQDLRRMRKDFRAVEDELVRLKRATGEDRMPRVVSNPGGARRPKAGPARVRSDIARVLKEVDRVMSGLVADRRTINVRLGAVDEDIRRLRMLYFTDACQGLERVVRDICQATRKEADLSVQGDKVELDRSILEGLRDPLLHLVRNAVDHGIEPAAEREAKGKPRRGKVWVTATVRGAQVSIEVGDDGRGLDLTAIRRAAGRPETGSESPEETARLVFHPGLSTAPIITEVSGRGVGLDVVRSQVEHLHGTVSVAFEPGRGTRFTLTAPVTLSKLRAVLVSIGNRIFAVPSTSIRAVARIDASDCRTIESREVVMLDGRPVATASLARALAIRSTDQHLADGRVPVVVVQAGEHSTAFRVDEVLVESVIVEKSLGDRLSGVPMISGAAVLTDGRIALVLNTAELVRATRPEWQPVAVPSPAAPPARKRLLIVDDSVTTRFLERSILEAAGYEVFDAVDGVEGWQMLQQKGADLVITDVEMPRMDGFALTEQIRASDKFRRMPVVLLTTMSSDQDRARGVEVGANAYLTKQDFDQGHLLDTLARLL